jgi:hypothetical protein
MGAEHEVGHRVLASAVSAGERCERSLALTSPSSHLIAYPPATSFSQFQNPLLVRQAEKYPSKPRHDIAR